jgi:signal transduction histidine kinase
MRLHELPLARKLTAIMMLASSAALLVASVVLAAYDAVTFRRALVDDLETTARIVGTNSTAALTFGDRAAAEDVLNALAAERQLVEAAVFDREGRPFARYLRDPSRRPSLAAGEPRGHGFTADSLALREPIVLDGERIGRVALLSDLGRLASRRAGFVRIVGVALLVALGVTLALSTRLQRVVSEPVLQLVATARRISEDRDYSLRAGVAGGGELGLLVGAFNDMVEQVEQRDAALRRSLERLESARQGLMARSREVERVNAELARSNRELEDFAFVASHDLQEPLRKIIAFGERLDSRERGALSAEGRDYVERMRRAAERMKALIDDLLAYSRVTTRAQPFAPVDLGEVVAEVLSDLEVRIEAAGADVEVGPLPAVVADRVQMRQLFQNLLVNALKFHRPGEAPAIRVAAAPADGDAEIEVADRGIGFDEKYLDRLFKPFHRLHGRDAYEGTGIGLAICKKIVERHHGSITASSRPGAGARFTIRLPLGQPDPNEESAS